MSVAPVTVFSHPVLQVRLAELREVSTPVFRFRSLLRQAGILLALHAAESLPTTQITVTTPLETTPGSKFARPLVLVPVLRAGLGFLDGILDFLPEAIVGHIGLYRNEETLEPCHYYCKLPPQTRGADVWILDPMLATGGSAVAAIDLVQKAEPATVTLICLVACPEGVARVQKSHPGVRILTAVIDRQLDGKGYILPGLGDAGDRIFGTT
jgi:uracil phosphoribosyltransferase